MFGFVVKAVDAHLDCFCFVTKDAIGTDDVDQAASGDDLFDTTIIEGLTDDVCPVSQTLTEVSVVDTQRSSNTLKDLLLSLRGRILLLEGDRETLKERLIQDIGADEASIVRTLTLGVSSGDDVETSSGFDPLTNLLEKDTLAF